MVVSEALIINASVNYSYVVRYTVTVPDWFDEETESHRPLTDITVSLVECIAVEHVVCPSVTVFTMAYITVIIVEL